ITVGSPKNSFRQFQTVVPLPLHLLCVGEQDRAELEAFARSRRIAWVTIASTASVAQALEMLLQATQSCGDPTVEQPNALHSEVVLVVVDTIAQAPRATPLGLPPPMATITPETPTLAPDLAPALKTAAVQTATAQTSAGTDGPIVGTLTALDLLRASSLGLNLAEMSVQLIMTPWIAAGDRALPPPTATPSPDPAQHSTQNYLNPDALDLPVKTPIEIPPDPPVDTPQKSALTLQANHLSFQADELQLLALLNASPCGFIAIDTEGNILFSNPTAQHLLGLTAENLQGWQLGIPLTDPTRKFQELEVHNAQGQWSIVTMDVTEILWNQEPAWLLSWVDVTELKAKESALQQQETYQRFLLEHIPVGILIQGSDATITYANSHACNFLQRPLSSILGLTFQELDLQWFAGDGDILSPDRCPVRQVIATEQPLASMKVGVAVTPDAISWVLVNAFPVMDAMGMLKEVVAAFVDTNPLKLAQQQLQKFNQVLEQEVAQRTAALQESNHFIQHITETSPDLLYLYDLEQQQIVYMNRDITTLLGYSPAETAALGAAFPRELLHPDDRDRVQHHYQTLDHIQASDLLRIEYRLRDRHGNWHWFSSRETFFMAGEHGTVRQIIGSTSEITIHKELETQLRQSNTELAHANRLKDQFLAVISHELRTPLNAILGMVEGLIDGVYGDLDRRNLPPIQTIAESGWHLLQMISDLLMLADLEACPLLSNPATVDLTYLCKTSLQLVQAQAQHKNLTLTATLPLIPQEIEADNQQIQRLLLNLLNNSIKFTPPGGQVTLSSIYQVWSGPDPDHLPQLTLNTPAAPGKTVYCVTVEDTGIGINTQALAQIFQPFIQADGHLNRTHSGTGIGLALVQRIVTLHQGWIQVWSTVNQGSRFAVYLPCQPLNAAAPLAPAPPAAASTLSPDRPQPLPSSPAASTTLRVSEHLRFRILLVEGNEANLASFSDYLSHRGYEITVARTEQEALNQTYQNRPDLILMDLPTPEGAGLEAIRQLRANPDFHALPILALTTLASPQDRDRCLSAGATAHISKPVRLKDLSTKIRQILS
ncbi:MAG: PAS domain S-box protein, partial [Prochlorothrix sp.]